MSTKRSPNMAITPSTSPSLYASRSLLLATLIAYRSSMPPPLWIRRVILRADPWDIQSNSIQPCLCTQIQGLAVIVAPSKIVWMLRPDNRAQVLAFRRNDPQSAGTGDIQVAVLIDF